MRENLARINLSLSDSSDDYEEPLSESENGDSKIKDSAGGRGVPLPLNRVTGDAAVLIQSRNLVAPSVDLGVSASGD